MAYRKREHVVEGFHDAEVGAVGGFLEAHELEDAHAFATDFAAELPDGQDIGIGIVGFESQQPVTEASPAAESFLRRAFQTRSDFSGSVTTVCTSSQNRGKGSPAVSRASGKVLRT